MTDLSRVLAGIEEQLSVPASLLKEIAERFQAAMTAGLAGKPSSLKMLPSYIGVPTGREQGTVVAVDFGGTNVRVLLITLTGDGQVHISNRRSFLLKDKRKNYDFTTASASGMQLFDFIAEKIAEIVPTTDKTYPLGHTFSFPCHQYDINEAELISWTKEIKTAGVEGQNVGQLLQAALERKKISYVYPQAIINDTTGTLLTAAYRDNATDIGAICGTGHNSCYLEPGHPLTNKPMIVNMESGNFSQIMQTKYDLCLDQDSEKPGAQRLEKQTSGQYLGEIVRIIVSSLVADGHMAGEPANTLHLPYSVRTEDLSTILADHTAGLEAVAEVVAACWNLGNLTLGELAALQTIARLVAIRSARLVAATWAGVLYRIDLELSRSHTIAVDGSLYEKMPGYAEYLAQAMNDIWGIGAKKVTIRLSKDGSGIGAAIAAATVYNSQ